MHSPTQLQQIIEDALCKENFDGKPSRLYQPVAYTISLGGKRLRPVLLLMGCELFEGNIDHAIKPAIGIELFHNFTLIHDDIMDDAPLRRGKSSVYRKWNTDIAILSGDVMFALAYKYISSAENNFNAILNVFNQTAIEVCEGQQYDMDFEEEDNVSINNYMNMISLKTAALLACSLKIGAYVGNADNKNARTIYNFGKYIGIAFQLRDDLLDVYADENKFGKQTGGDIKSAKKTFLYLKALEISDSKLRKTLKSIYNDNSMVFSEKVDKVRSIYDRLSIQTLTNKEIEKHTNSAFKELENVEVDNIRKEPLVDYTRELMSRVI